MTGSINWSKSAYTPSQIVRAAMTAAGVRGKIYNEPRSFGRSVKIYAYDTGDKVKRANDIAEMLLRFHGFKVRRVVTPKLRPFYGTFGGNTRFWIEE